MNSQASRVAVVNQVARQLIHSGHPSEKEIKAQQDKLNTRYSCSIMQVETLNKVKSRLLDGSCRSQQQGLGLNWD